MFRQFSALALLLCSMNVLGCSGGSGNECSRDEDCESNFCRADGTCGEAQDDGGPGDSMPPDMTSELCTPNHDDSIVVGELPLRAGRMANFRVATDATFDTAGSAAGGGMRRWDLSGALANDVDTEIVLASSAGAYWAADFPAATYAAPLAAGSNLLGVFHVDATAVTLLGVVSPAAGTFGTNITYDPPAIILKLPVAPNAQWSSSSTVSGTLNGGFVNYTENYESIVDSVGTMKTPYGEFPVLRVATNMEQLQIVTPFGGKRSFAWLAECFGSVANITSQDFESSSEFDDPAEVRRLAP
ncbi:MAG: hypothetical protein ACKV2T_34570 [Kofleriaceae bacterium]